MKAGGRAGIVIKDTFLSNTDFASIEARKRLWNECDVHTILDCPRGVFPGAGQATVVLFFVKGSSTKTTWYYRISPERTLGKTNPLTDSDMEDFLEKHLGRHLSDNSWSFVKADLDQSSYILTPPRTVGEVPIEIRHAAEILQELKEMSQVDADLRQRLQDTLNA